MPKGNPNLGKAAPTRTFLMVVTPRVFKALAKDSRWVRLPFTEPFRVGVPKRKAAAHAQG